MRRSRRFVVESLFAGSALGLLLPRSARAEDIDYVYDALGRLRKVTYEDGSVVYYNYDAAGNRVSVIRNAPGTDYTATLPITGAGSVNLRSLAELHGYDGARNATVTFTLASGVTIIGAAGAPNGGIGIDTGTWPTGSHTITLALQVTGKVYGGGGGGGWGVQMPATEMQAGNGGVGGDAVYCRLPMSITVNSGGEIKAGGGGGGGGATWYNSSSDISTGGGGGGGGFPNGAVSAGGASPQNFDHDGVGGAAGTTGGGGAGGAHGGVSFSRTPGNGGNGGAAGATGAAGGAGSGSQSSGWVKRLQGSGGAAGFAIRKNGHTVTVTNNGTITGTIG